MKKFKNILESLNSHLSTDGKQIDLANQIKEAIGKKAFFHIAKNVERIHADEIRKLNLIQRAFESEKGINALFDNKTHYLQKRYKD